MIDHWTTNFPTARDLVRSAWFHSHTAWGGGGGGVWGRTHNEDKDGTGDHALDGSRSLDIHPQHDITASGQC